MNNNLKIVEQNILLADAQVVAHCCNNMNKMGSGVARALRCRFPEVYATDTKSYINFGSAMLGKCVLVPITTLPNQTKLLYVANLYGQLGYGTMHLRYVHYEGFYLALESLIKQMSEQNMTRLALPYKIGADRAGGNWNIIETMVKEVIKGSNIEVTLYKLPKKLM